MCHCCINNLTRRCFINSLLLEIEIEIAEINISVGFANISILATKFKTFSKIILLPPWHLLPRPYPALQQSSFWRQNVFNELSSELDAQGMSCYRTFSEKDETKACFVEKSINFKKQQNWTPWNLFLVKACRCRCSYSATRRLTLRFHFKTVVESDCINRAHGIATAQQPWKCLPTRAIGVYPSNHVIAFAVID